MPKMVKVHVTFNETKRILSHQKGGEVKDLRHLFLQVFSDVLLDQVAPAAIKLQRYDPSFEDYVELNSDEKLEDDIKIRALVSKQDKQAVTPSTDEVETNSKRLHCGPHWMFPWIHIHGTSENCFPATCLFPARQTTNPVKMHPINADTNYRMWSLVSRKNGGMLHRHNNDVHCDGSFSGLSNTVITTSAISQDYVSLIFKDGDKQYVVTAEGDGNNINIKAVESSSGFPYPDNATFVADYFWSYTMFKNKQYNTQYLGSDTSGNTTLVDMTALEYPNPQALFILIAQP